MRVLTWAASTIRLRIDCSSGCLATESKTQRVPDVHPVRPKWNTNSDEEREQKVAKRKYSEEQILGVVKQLEAGRTAAEMAGNGLSFTIYSWKTKYGGMEPNDAQRLLEDENSRLKRLVADLRNAESGLARRAIADDSLWSSLPQVSVKRESWPTSHAQVCRYRASTDDALREKLTQLAHEKPRYGYRRLAILLRTCES